MRFRLSIAEIKGEPVIWMIVSAESIDPRTRTQITRSEFSLIRGKLAEERPSTGYARGAYTKERNEIAALFRRARSLLKQRIVLDIKNAQKNIQCAHCKKYFRVDYAGRISIHGPHDNICQGSRVVMDVQRYERWKRTNAVIQNNIEKRRQLIEARKLNKWQRKVKIARRKRIPTEAEDSCYTVNILEYDGPSLYEEHIGVICWPVSIEAIIEAIEVAQ